MAKHRPKGKDCALAPSPAMPRLEQILAGKRLLLTGATGFLGKVFLYLLLRWHPEIGRVYLLIRGDGRSSHARLRREILDSPAMGPLRDHAADGFDRLVEDKLAVVAGDISVKGLFDRSVKEPDSIQVDAVVHCAGLVNFEASLERALSINTLGVANVLAFCRQRRAAMLHVSTCYAAGEADGHRFEDDLPVNWCPRGAGEFHLDREIRDALAEIARVEAESHDQVRKAELFEDGPGTGGDVQNGADSNGDISTAGVGGSGGSFEARRKRWVEEQLKEAGRQRAAFWGWPNTYSYTKSLGEQLVFAARDKLRIAVVRPSIIESALRDPFPGWNQGVNTSAPLTYLSGRGYRFYPADPKLVLDIIPVDLAAHAMVPILAALLAGRHESVYQLATSDVNPFPMGRLVELTGLGNRREQRAAGGLQARLAPHIEAVVVSRPTYELLSGALPRMLKQAAQALAGVLGKESSRARKLQDRAGRLADNAEFARSLVEVYRPYIQDLAYTFHSRNIRELYSRLAPADAARHPYDPERLDWADYWTNVHLPGLRRHIFGQLDFHRRSRTRTALRFRTLLAMLDHAAERYGARPALVARKPSGERVTVGYRELRDRARRTGLMLAGCGVEPGDRVMLIGENSPDWVLAYFAILFAGAIAVPLDPMVSADELRAIGEIAAPKAVIRSAAVARRLSDGIHGAAPGAVELELEGLDRPFVLRRGTELRAAPERSTAASIVFTSGTTGAPKGVTLTHGNFAAQVQMLGKIFALSGEDVVLSLLPLHHTLEFTCGMLLPLACGATVVYPLGVDAASLARTLADIRPTALVGVPALWEAVHRRIVDEIEARGPFVHAGFNQLCELNRRLDREFSVNLGSILFKRAHDALGGRLRLAISGGAALPVRVAEFFNDIGIRLLEGYGLTEAAPVVSVARPDEPLQGGSVGKSLAGVELRIASSEPGGVGEILVRGPNVMAGYYRNSAATAEVLNDGWLHTGDLGRLDAEGRLYIVGRAKEVIVDSGGNNIYIDELEQVYGQSPYIKELAVVGLKVGEGEQSAALIVPAYAKGESRRAVEDHVLAHCDKVGASLSPHKRIRILRFTDTELPRTRTRKIQRATVAATLARMLGHDESAPSVEGSAEIEPWLLEVLGQVAGGAARIKAQTRLIEDLGLDSLALAELGERISVHGGRELTPEDLTEVRTVADVQRLLSQGQRRPRLPSYARFANPYTVTIPAPLRRLTERAVEQAQELVFSQWLRPRVLGRGNVPSNRNLLVIANHSSHFDFGLVGYALGPLGRELVVLAARDYFFNTPARRFFAANFTRLIPFDRERAQLDSLDDALSELLAGRSVLMFPEGTRSLDGEIQEFKSGAGYLALRSGCDVLPIHIRGTHEVLGKGRLIPRWSPVEVRIGRVIEAEELRRLSDEAAGALSYRLLADRMRQGVVELGAAPLRPVTPRSGEGGIAERVVAEHAEDASAEDQRCTAREGARRTRGRGRAKA